MNLKQIREEKKFTQPDVVELIQTVEPRMTVPMLSIIEAGAVLTNPETLKALCHYFGVEPSDIYSKSEMNLSNCLGNEIAVSAKEPDRHRNTLRQGFRISETAYKSFNEAVFRLGYRTKQEWFDDMVKKTVMEAERKARADEREAAV